MDAVAVDVDQVASPTASRCCRSVFLGCGPERAEQGEGEDDAHHAGAGAEDGAQEAAAAEHHLAPVLDGRRHGLAPRCSVEARRVALLDEGALREQVLAPGRQAEAEAEEPDAAEHTLPLGLATHPVQTAVGAEPGQADEQEQADERLGPPRVLGDRAAGGDRRTWSGAAPAGAPLPERVRR